MIYKQGIGWHVDLKVANMRKPDSFILYPYSGGDYLRLQSGKRFIRLNLRTGVGLINRKGKDYANSLAISLDPLPFQMPEEVVLAIKGHLWNSSGMNGNEVLRYENMELYSEKKDV